MKWPYLGTKASYLFKSAYEVIVSSDLLNTDGFWAFYQEWISGIKSDGNREIILSFNGQKNNADRTKYKGVSISDANYEELFDSERSKEGIIFLTGNPETARNMRS